MFAGLGQMQLHHGVAHSWCALAIFCLQALAKHAADCARLAAEDLAPCASVKVHLCLELSQLLQHSVQQVCTNAY